MLGLPPPQAMVYIFSLIALVLGFIAFVTQKAYVDSASGQVIEIEVSGIGRFKTNIPALVFVVGGIGLAAFAYFPYFRDSIHFEPWTIEGTFRSKDEASPLTSNEINNLNTGVISFQPSRTREPASIHGGTFRFQYEIPEGKDFEHEIYTIQYLDNPDFVGTIIVDQATPVAKGQNYRKYNFDIERKAK